MVLRIAVSSYDHVRDLAVEGEAVAVEHPGLEELFYRFDRHPEWDAFEISMAKFAGLVSQGDRSLVGLPVFLGRAFRHGSIYGRRDGAREPAGLKGGRIGVPDWTQTTSIYARAVLMREYGLKLGDVRWVQGGIDKPNPRPPAVPPLQGVACAVETERSLSEMLLSSDLDALIATQPPKAWIEGNPGIRRLFDDPAAEEAVYYARTGIYPIMHAVVLRRPVVEQSPELPERLFAAFAEAKRKSQARLLAHGGMNLPLPWIADAVRHAQALFGADYWPYGLAKNQRTLEAFLDFAYEQQALSRAVSVEEMFLGIDP